MKQYLDLLHDILYNGVDKSDRTGTGTRSVFGRQLRFDLSEGFPLVTTKKMFWKGVAEELLFFISGSTNIQDLGDDTQKWWAPWADRNGNLGPIYSHQLRNFGGAYKNVCQPKPKYPFSPINPEEKEVHLTPSGKEFVIVRVDGNFTTIQFLASGYLKTMPNYRVLNRNHLDPYSLSVYSVGYLEDANLTRVYPKLTRKWRAMLKRCYSESYDNYSYYGGKGVYVVDRWLSLKNFIEDARILPGYKSDLMGLELDKDIVGNGFTYGPDTCIWCSQQDNKSERTQNIEYVVRYKDGSNFTFKNATKFMAANGVKNPGNFNSMLRGKRNAAEGFSLVSRTDNRIGVDQLKTVVSSLMTDTDSRRHVISMWNATDLPYQALPCCHGTVVQFYVANGELSCSTYQRSADVFLGFPVNIASYALLTHMLAQQCGYEVGELIYTTGDTHLYHNHGDQARLQLSREPYPLPKLVIKRKPESIFDYQIEDFELVGYQHHPAIKAPVAV